MPLPTYATLIPDVLLWAVDRQLIHPDGTANLATPQAQHAKTVEEIGEAHEALAELNNTKVLAIDMMGADYPLAGQCMETGPRQDLALEFGDVLVTLVLQSSLQGKAFEYCLSAAPAVGRPQIWPYVDEWAEELSDSISNPRSLFRFDAPAEIGAIARCVEDVARIELSLTGPECLALALTKISGRRGKVVDGVFVKAG